MTVINYNSLGHRIKVQRLNRGMTQEQLAEIMCVPKSTISAYENNKVDIKSSVIVELSRVLDVSPNYLLGVDMEDDPVIVEIVTFLHKVHDNKIKSILYAQIMAISEISI